LVRLQVKQLSEEIFKLDERIQYAAIFDQSNTLIQSQERNGNMNNLTVDAIKQFTAITPLIMLGSASRLEPYFGGVEHIVIKYGDRLVAIYRLTALFVVLILQGGIEPETVQKIGTTLRKMTD
jgi:hypothetical protein